MLPNPPMMIDDALRDRVLAYANADVGSGGLIATGISGLSLIRGNRETSLEHVFYEPALIVVIAGSKELLFGDERFTYEAGQYLVVSVGLPIMARITAGSDELPYLALALTLQLPIVNDLMDRLGHVTEFPEPPDLGLFTGTLDAPQAAVIARLGALLSSREALSVLYPSIAIELFYWLLTGRDGAQFRRLAMPDSHTQRIAVAINAMRADLTDSLSVEHLATLAHMSPSSFHRHFKAITSMSPLQYRKQLRLLEARRFMLADGADATRAAYHVGYESTSQFSREYTRMFGAPPRRDVAGRSAVLAHR